MTQNAYDRDLDRNPANFQPLTPLSFLERAAEVFPDRLAIAHGGLRRNYREFHARTKKLGFRARQAGLRARRHGRRHARQHARNARMPLWRPDVRRRAQCAQHPPRRGLDRLHARSWRGQGDRRRPRILRGRRRGAEACRGEAAGHRLRRSRIRRPWRAAGGARLRGAGRRGRRGLRSHRARRRMGRDRAQLHLGHDRRPEGRRLPSSRREPARRRQRRHRRHRPPSGLSLDAADVPLQRLVLSLVDQRQGGRACLPAAGARQADLRPHRRAEGDAHVRRADRHVDPAQRRATTRSGRCRMSCASSPPPRRRPPRC